MKERNNDEIEGEKITVIITDSEKSESDSMFYSEDLSYTNSDGQKLDEKELKKRKQEMKKRRRQTSAVWDIFSMLLYVGAVIAATFLIINYVGQRTEVKGTSMETTLSNKDNLIVDKISYRFRDPERFDIIVFPYLLKEDTYYIKRIIGLPGETVQIIDGVIYIDGEVLEEDYGTEVMQVSGVAEDPIVLADDEYFVLGDNRNASADSRQENVGNIKRSDIMGRAWLRIWPLSKFGILKHQ